MCVHTPFPYLLLFFLFDAPILKEGSDVKPKRRQSSLEKNAGAKMQINIAIERATLTLIFSYQLT